MCIWDKQMAPIFTHMSLSIILSQVSGNSIAIRNIIAEFKPSEQFLGTKVIDRRSIDGRYNAALSLQQRPATPSQLPVNAPSPRENNT